MTTQYTMSDVFAMIDSNDMNGLRRILDTSPVNLGICRFAMIRTIGEGNLEILKMFYDDYPNIFSVRDVDLANAIYGSSQDVAMYIISRGPPLTDSSMLLDAWITKMYDVLDVLIDHGLIEKTIETWDDHAGDTPKDVRYFVKMGGWIEGLNPRDYMHEISSRKHDHVPSINAFLDAKDTRVYDYQTDIDVICCG